MEGLLKSIVEKNRSLTDKGRVATYIPELSKADPGALGACISKTDGEEYCAGDCDTVFTMQSISKIVLLILAIGDNGFDALLEKVGVEPTAASFNSIVDLETRNYSRPLNPMINSGAIVTTSMIKGDTCIEQFERVLGFASKMSGNPGLKIDEEVYSSEKATGHRNRALAYYMKSTGVLEEEVEDVLDVYFKVCSMEVTCKDIARIGAVLANDGTAPWNGERLFHKDTARIVKSIMMTCGMYDESGDFAVNVGVPGKSGVGGGILAVVPHSMGIGVIGPSLDKKGNSIGGLGILTDLSRELDFSIF